MFSLRSLIVQDCTALTSLPESLGSAPNLEDLMVWHNPNLVVLPESLGSAPNLLRLRISNNGIVSVPESLGYAPKLEGLDISENPNLTLLPESLGLAPSLKAFMVWYNPNLTALPESLGNAPSLVEVVARNNNLTSVPESLGFAPNLKTLVIRENPRLASLPESLGQNQALRMIDARSCAITHFPRALFNCHPDTEILLSHNPFSDQEINAIQAEIQRRRDQNIPTPQITLPPLRGINQRALAAPQNIMQNAAANNGHAHAPALTKYVTQVLNTLIEKFSSTFHGSVDDQKNQLRAIQVQLTAALTEHAKEHAQFHQGMPIVSSMFEKGLGEQREFINDFAHTPGHVLAYAFTAMQVKWQSAANQSERTQLQSEHLHGIITALTYFVRDQVQIPCDTRNIEEIAQLVQAYDLTRLPLSTSQMREIAAPIVNNLLDTLIQQHPDADDNTLQQHLLPLFVQSMQGAAPLAPTPQIEQFFENHIIPAWDSLKEVALNSTRSGAVPPN